MMGYVKRMKPIRTRLKSSLHRHFIDMYYGKSIICDIELTNCTIEFLKKKADHFGKGNHQMQATH